MTKPIDIMTGGQHSRDIAAKVCTLCGKAAREFRDELSKREHGISGFCKVCQDETFGSHQEDE